MDHRSIETLLRVAPQTGFTAALAPSVVASILINRLGHVLHQAYEESATSTLRIDNSNRCGCGIASRIRHGQNELVSETPAGQCEQRCRRSGAADGRARITRCHGPQEG